METNAQSRAALIAAAVVTLLGGKALARPIETTVVPGLSVRNGDWVAVDALGIALIRPDDPANYFAVVMRTELAIGGVSAGVGLGTNLLSGPRGASDLSDFLGSAILSLEARAERTYGPTSWRRTTYVGGQLSLAAILIKPAIGWMIAVDDPRDAHFQITLVGGGW